MNPFKPIKESKLSKAKRYGKVAGMTAGTFWVALGPALVASSAADPLLVKSIKNKKALRAALIARGQIGTAIAGKAAHKAYKISAEKI